MSKSKLEETLAYHLRVAGITGWEREYRFHSVRRWEFDFAFVSDKVAVEAEGGTWSGGRHTRGGGFAKDCEKYNTAALMGWTVLRFTGDMINSGVALATIERILERIKDGHA